MKQFSISPPYSILLLGDLQHRSFPEIKDQAINFTDHCIVVATYTSVDGPTIVKIGDEHETADRGRATFRAPLVLPTGTFTIQTAERDIVFKRTCSNIIRVAIWLNHPREPDEIVIALAA